MNPKMRIIRGLMCVYPRTWRSEYGCELANTLHQSPLTRAVIFDVLQNGICQRLRYARYSQLGGSFLLLWMLFGTVANSFSPFSGPTYGRFWAVNSVIYFLVGYLTARKPDKNLRESSFASGKAAFIAILPEFIILALWSAHLIHPTVLDLNGSPSIIGHGFTEFCFRLSKGVPVKLPEMFLVLPVASLLPAIFVGYVGAVTSKTISAFKAGFHRVGTR